MQFWILHKTKITEAWPEDFSSSLFTVYSIYLSQTNKDIAFDLEIQLFPTIETI